MVDDEIRFSVTDNGTGFEPAKANEMFDMFKPLHRKDEFEGNGVGLAIVAQVIQRHAGSVRAEGHPGEGARFDLSFPRVPAIAGLLRAA